MARGPWKDKKGGTQEQFAGLVGISQSEVSQLMRKGVLSRNGTLIEWIRQYCKNLREQAAQHKSEDGIDRVKEAALLDRRKREEIELRMAEKNGELLAASVFVEGTSNTFTAVKYGLLALPNKFKMRCPHISQSDIETLRSLHRDVCAELNGDQFPSRIRKELEAKLSGVEVAAEADGEPVGGRQKETELRK